MRLIMCFAVASRCFPKQLTDIVDNKNDTLISHDKLKEGVEFVTYNHFLQLTRVQVYMLQVKNMLLCFLS